MVFDEGMVNGLIRGSVDVGHVLIVRDETGQLLTGLCAIMTTCAPIDSWRS